MGYEERKSSSMMTMTTTMKPRDAFNTRGHNSLFQVRTIAMTKCDSLTLPCVNEARVWRDKERRLEDGVADAIHPRGSN